MSEYEGQRRPVGRVAIIVSRYNEMVTGKLLAGARATCAAAGIPDDQVDVLWVPGAFELGAVAMAAARSGRYGALVALGVVIRGETPHFEFVAGEASRQLGEVILTAITAPQRNWKSTLAACQAAYAAEVNNTKQINALMDQAIKENDHATRVILEWFVEEQVEEESSALNLIKQVQLADNAPGAILLLDRELGGRTPDAGAEKA